MDEKKKYQISVLGETIRLISDENSEYIDSLVRHVEGVVGDLPGSGADASAASILLYASIIITDQLFKERAESARLKEEFEQFVLEFDKDNKGNHEKR